MTFFYLNINISIKMYTNYVYMKQIINIKNFYIYYEKFLNRETVTVYQYWFSDILKWRRKKKIEFNQRKFYEIYTHNNYSANIIRRRLSKSFEQINCYYKPIHQCYK